MAVGQVHASSCNAYYDSRAQERDRNGMHGILLTRLPLAASRRAEASAAQEAAICANSSRNRGMTSAPSISRSSLELRT